MFWQNKNMLHSATVVQFPFSSLPTKAFAEILDCVEALDHICPQFLQAESLLGFEQR
jgi:hypothetical protein